MFQKISGGVIDNAIPVCLKRKHQFPSWPSIPLQPNVMLVFTWLEKTLNMHSSHIIKPRNLDIALQIQSNTKVNKGYFQEEKNFVSGQHLYYSLYLYLYWECSQKQDVWLHMNVSPPTELHCSHNLTISSDCILPSDTRIFRKHL